MKRFFNPKSLPHRARNIMAVTAVVVGVAVGAVAIFEKPLIQAATDFFSSC